MKRNINTIKAIPAFELKTKGNDKERKYKSDLEKPKKIHRSSLKGGDTRKEIKYLHLNN